MLATDWIDLLRRFSAEDFQHLAFTLTNGTEIAVRQLIRMDPQCMLVRGRIGGTTDTDKVFCIPYENIVYFSVARALRDERLAQIYGRMAKPADTAPAAAPAEYDDESAAPGAPGQPKAPIQPAAAMPDRPHPAVVTSLRERLRARLAGRGDEPKPKTS